MNIEQIQSDLANGVIVSPGTWRKLVEAALIMQRSLSAVEEEGLPREANEILARTCRQQVEAM